MMADKEEQQKLLQKISEVKMKLNQEPRQVLKDLHIENLDTDLIDHEKNISTLQNLDILVNDKNDNENLHELDDVNQDQDLSSPKLDSKKIKTAWD